MGGWDLLCGCVATTAKGSSAVIEAIKAFRPPARMGLIEFADVGEFGTCFIEEQADPLTTVHRCLEKVLRQCIAVGWRHRWSAFGSCYCFGMRPYGRTGTFKPDWSAGSIGIVNSGNGASVKAREPCKTTRPRSRVTGCGWEVARIERASRS